VLIVVKACRFEEIGARQWRRMRIVDDEMARAIDVFGQLLCKQPQLRKQMSLRFAKHLDHRLGEVHPAGFRVRVRLARLDGQRGVEHQHAATGPLGDVAMRRSFE
jgi:hypothetical protein